MVEQTCAARSYGARPSAQSVAEIRRRPALREALIEGRLTGSSLIEIYKADKGTLAIRLLAEEGLADLKTLWQRA